jgi:hypothetical protein
MQKTQHLMAIDFQAKFSISLINVEPETIDGNDHHSGLITDTTI